MSDEITISFPPVTVGDATYESIVLREPTVGEMLKISTLRGLNASIDLVAMISGVPRPAILLMPISALRQANDFLDRFTQPPEDPEGNVG